MSSGYDDDEPILIKGIPLPVTSLLRRLSNIKHIKQRTPVFFQNDMAERLYIVLDGWVKLYNITADGQEIVLGMLTSGDVFGAACIFGERKQSYTAESFRDTQLMEIEAVELRRHFHKNPKLSEWLMSVMAGEVQDLLVRNGQMTSMSAPQRLGCLLLRLSSWMVGEGGTFSLPYGKSVAAAQLGVNPATFSRILMRLQDVGVYANGSEIRIESFSRLSEFCCSNCPLCSVRCSGRRIASRDTSVEECKRRIMG